jgi:hypothetical protein
MKIKRRRFTVRGSGSFPFDMLRYDQCWPESESRDSWKLDVTPMTDEYYGQRREVTLLTDSPYAPTVDRWKSFTWEVLKSDVGKAYEDVR